MRLAKGFFLPYLPLEYSPFTAVRLPPGFGRASAGFRRASAGGSPRLVRNFIKDQSDIEKKPHVGNDFQLNEQAATLMTYLL